MNLTDKRICRGYDPLRLQGGRLRASSRTRRFKTSWWAGCISIWCGTPTPTIMWICQVDVGAGDARPDRHRRPERPRGRPGSRGPARFLPARRRTRSTAGKLRGVESNGMLCSLKELGLTDRRLPLAPSRTASSSIHPDLKALAGRQARRRHPAPSSALDDHVVEFEITPNRPDCLSPSSAWPGRPPPPSTSRCSLHDARGARAAAAGIPAELLDVETPAADLLPPVHRPDGAQREDRPLPQVDAGAAARHAACAPSTTSWTSPTMSCWSTASPCTPLTTAM